MIRFALFAMMALALPHAAIAETFVSNALGVTSIAEAQAALAQPFDPAPVEDEAAQPAKPGAITVLRTVATGTAARRVGTCAELNEAIRQGYDAGFQDNETAFYGDWLRARCQALAWLAKAKPAQDNAPDFSENLIESLPGWFTTNRSCPGLWKAMQASMRGEAWQQADDLELESESAARLDFETKLVAGTIELLGFADLDGDQQGEMIVAFEARATFGAVNETHVLRLKRGAEGWVLFDPAVRLRALVRTCPDQLGMAFAGACATE